MAYTADQQPDGLEALTDLATADIVIAGDTSDSGRVKGITWANLKTAISTFIASATQTFTNKTFDANGTGNSISNIDLTADVIGIAPSANGGTGNGFTKFTGATTAEKTYTLPDANATILYSGGDAGTPSAIVLTNASGTITNITLVTPALGTPSSGDLSSCTAAGAAQVGVVELATTAEIDTGTDTTRAIPIDQLVASKRNVRWLVFSLVEAATDCATATNIYGDFVSPIAGTILQSDTTPFYLYATNSTAGTTGTMVVDVSLNGTSIMTTNKLDFDTTEKTTTTAATPPDLTDTTLAVGDIITIDIDAIHTTASKGLTVYMAIRE